MAKKDIYRVVSDKDKAFQDNKLIEGRLQQLSLREQKLVLIAFSRVKKNDKYGETYVIKVKEIFDLLEYAEDGHSEIKKSAITLSEKGIFIEEEKGGWVYYPFFSMIRYVPHIGEIQVRFDKDITDMIKNLMENFTPLELREICGAKCSYSVKLFQLLKQYHPKIKTRYLTIEELKKKLGIENKYKNRTDNLRNKVLEVAMLDMNENSSLTFNYSMRKEGVKVVGVDFEIVENRQAIIKKFNTEQKRIEKEPMIPFYKILNQLGLYGLNDKVGFGLIDKVGENEMENIIKEALQLNSNGAIPVEKIGGTIINMARSFSARLESKRIEKKTSEKLKKLIESHRKIFTQEKSRVKEGIRLSDIEGRYVSASIAGANGRYDSGATVVYGKSDFKDRLERFLVPREKDLSFRELKKVKVK